jgi:hypothetical protein
LDGDHGQRETIVIETMREMESEWPVSEPMLLGRLTGSMSLKNARKVVEKMREKGRLTETADGLEL